MDNKISNVIGVPIPQWLVEQFNVRSKKGSTYDRRGTQELQFLANKTAWVRLVSSIEVSGDDNRYFSKYMKDEKLIKYSIDNNKETYSTSVNSLAKNFMLFAGTSKYEKKENGVVNNMRSGINNGAYGMLGEREIKEYGYTPMPGITSVTIETMGRMGSVKSATVNFKVFDKLQLDIIDALYFKLGYTMLLEWGHTYYYETAPNTPGVEPVLKSTEDLMIDPFQANLTKDKINYQISLNVQKSYGNYDGMLGMVTNFNFSRKEDGSYDCSVKMIGLGALAESLKINRVGVYVDALKTEISRLIESENKKRQDQINYQTKSSKEEIEKLKQQKKEIEDEIKSFKSLNDIFQDKIRKNKIKRENGTDDELVDYLYSPFFRGQSDIYNSNLADILYDPEKSWAIRKFGIILQESTQISSVELSANSLRLIIPEYNRIKKIDDTQFLYDEQASRLDRYEASYSEKEYNYALYIDSPNLSTEERERGVNSIVKYRPTRKIKVQFIYEYNEPIIEEVKKQFYEKITKENIVYSDVKFSVNEIDFGFGGVTEKRIKEAVYTNKLNTTNRKKYYSSLEVQNIFDVQLKKGGVEDVVEVKYVLNVYDSGLIQNITVKNPENQISKEYVEKNNKKAERLQKLENDKLQIESQIQAIVDSLPKIDITKAQEDEANKFKSAIESALRTIQIYSLNRATQQKMSITKIDFLSENQKLAKTIFSEVGLYSQYYDKVVKNTLQDIPNYGKGEVNGDLLEFYMKYGFNVSLMSNSIASVNKSNLGVIWNAIENKLLRDRIAVNHAELLESYVIPYQVSQEFSQGVVLERPVYIKLGTLLMLFNHMSSMYESQEDKSSKKSPIFYVDYNPNTNFCLTSLNHLSTNPFNFIIPYSGEKENFKQLFEKSALEKIPDSEIFDRAKDDVYSGALPQFIENGAKNKKVYQGKVMNVLIDIDYILNTIKKFSNSDNTNSVYFKAFIDNILSDMCKALGNYNLLRLAYNDSANCFYIVDDQLIPPMEGEKEATRTSTKSSIYEIPLYGKESIAKSLDIKTDISSKLSNMIAISANSEKYQSEMGMDTTPFGYVNKNFTDRYVRNRGDSVLEDAENKKKDSSITTGDEDNAKKFNDAIKFFYGYVDAPMDYVNGATNYYISRMANIKATNPASRASAIIPVSVNFTTDGISGFNMYQSFGINEELLPYTYSAKNNVNGKSIERQVGFCVVGLSHTIENNQWNTSVRSNMIFLKDPEDYKGEKSVVPPSSDAKLRNEEYIDYDVKQNVGNIKPSKNYNQFISIPGVKDKVQDIANYLGVRPSDLYVVFASESGFDSTVVNSIGATGLIQFMPKTATALGTTGNELKSMPVIEQLNYVKKYYAPYKGKVKDVYDLYLVTFFPAALGKSNSYVFQTKNISAEKISVQNPAIATAAGKRPGVPLTVSDFKVYVSKKIKQFTDIPV